MQRSWKPVTAGILSIVAGTLNITFALVLLFFGSILAGALSTIGLPGLLPFLPFPILAGAAMPLVILGTISIVGGAYAVRRRIWPLAFAGAICALFPPQLTILGVLAIIFIVLGKDEFI